MSVNVATLKIISEPKPFLKWAGGKSSLLNSYKEHFPMSFNTYFEPFVGSGAVFFYLKPESAYICDINEELINTYNMVKSSVMELIEELQHYVYDKDFYYRIRSLDPLSLTDVQRAARFIYLNRTCFNGLYRVNRKGQFNVPIGRYKNPLICDKENLIAAGNYLKHVNIVHGDFELVTQKAKKGDFIYFDPPYQPLNETSYFTSYTENGFTINEQERLCEVYKKLSKRGCYVLLSNSNTKIIRDFYKDFRIIEVSAKRSINSVGNKRGKISELLIKSW